jgi:hypothetical protein
VRRKNLTCNNRAAKEKAFEAQQDETPEESGAGAGGGVFDALDDEEGAAPGGLMVRGLV